MSRQAWRGWLPTKAEAAVVAAAIVVGAVGGLLTRPDRSIRRTEVLDRAVTTTVPVASTRSTPGTGRAEPGRPPSRPVVTTSATTTTTTPTTTTTTGAGPDATVPAGTGSTPAGPTMPVLGLVEVDVMAVGVRADGSVERVAVARFGGLPVAIVG